MTKALTLLNRLIICLALTCCIPPASAQEAGPTLNGTVTVVFNESKPIATSTNFKTKPTHDSGEQVSSSKTQPAPKSPQSRPGERVTNPEHLILNSDTKLGGVAVNGPNPNDHGYLGPGDMRTHLWNGHSRELIQNGITENKLMAMMQPEVQKWHNYFHHAGGHPEHDSHPNHISHADHNYQQPLPHHGSLGQQPAPTTSPIYFDQPAEGIIVYGNSQFDQLPHYDHSVYAPETIAPQGVIIEGSTFYGSAIP